MLLLLIALRLVRRFHRGALCVLLSVQLAWMPVHTARAALPAVALGIGIVALRVYQLAAAGVGSALTASGLTATQAAAGGIAGAGLLQFADQNWADIVTYTKNATASYMTGVSSGTPSYASMASSVNVNTVSTDTTSYSWAPIPGSVTATVGNVPMKDPIASDNSSNQFASSDRWDGYKKYLPAANSYSTVYNASGFKTYLCPVLSPSINEPDNACRSLPEMPYAQFKYQAQYQSIASACNEPQDCARAYVSARLLHLSGSINTNAGTTPEGQYYFQQAITNVAVSFASCTDARVSQYSSFSYWRCPVTLSYSQAYLTPGQAATFAPVTEQIAVDVQVQRPPFGTGTSLNDYIDRYPLAGGESVMPASLAAVFDAMFRAAAAKPGYSGLNYFPITAAHVSAALQPGEMVRLDQMVAPITGAGTGTQPGTGNPTAPGGSTTVDLGPNPGIATPALEALPTAAQIMAPIFEMFPSVRNFSVPGHTGQCPALVIPLWGQDVSTNKHCELIEQQRSTIGAAALVGWSIVALLVVLGA